MSGDVTTSIKLLVHNIISSKVLDGVAEQLMRAHTSNEFGGLLYFSIVLYRGIAASMKHHFAAPNKLLVHDQQSLLTIQEE